MPWMVLSHQGPVLPLKHWKPEWFSGLGLCLGSVAPDLEFVLRIDNDWVVSHTLAAQLYFTTPLVVILYAILVGLAVPFWLPLLPDGPPWHFGELQALRLPTTLAGWARVAVSGMIGGLTHVALDGVTHGNHSGWLVPYLPFLRLPVAFAGHLPLHDVLQIALSVWLGAAAWLSWQEIGREGLLWRWRGESRRAPTRPMGPHGLRTQMWLFGWAGLGLVIGSTQRASAGLATAIELGAYGALAFSALAMVIPPVGDHVRRFVQRWVAALRPVPVPDDV